MTNFRLTWVDFTRPRVPNSRDVEDSNDLTVIAMAAQAVVDKLVRKRGYAPNNHSIIILNSEEIWSFIEGEYTSMAIVVFSHPITGEIEHVLYLNKTLPNTPK